MLTKYYTLAEVAEMLGRSQRQVYRDIYSGSLHARKVGAQWRVSEEDYEAFVNGASDGVSSFDALVATLAEARPQLNDAERMRLMSVIMAGD